MDSLLLIGFLLSACVHHTTLSSTGFEPMRIEETCGVTQKNEAVQKEIKIRQTEKYAYRSSPFRKNFTLPIKSQTLTSPFGLRRHPLRKSMTLHEGMDIRGKQGDTIRAVYEGHVVFAGSRGGYGLTVDIDCGDGLITRYAHMQVIIVQKGYTIEQGTVIGAVGHTGQATASHLHFEVRLHDTPIDPMLFMPHINQWTFLHNQDAQAMRTKVPVCASQRFSKSITR